MCVFQPHCRYRRAAFTLAEVLITLGIIGIVAALTITTLVGNYQKKVVGNKLKKFYSAYTQALKLSEVEHGDISTWNHMEAGIFGDYAHNIQFLNEYLFKYMNIVAICPAYPHAGKKCGSVDIVQFGDGLTRVLFQDGSCLGLMNITTNNDALSRGVAFNMIYDTNCDSGPNKDGRDRFYFTASWGINEADNMKYYPLSPFSVNINPTQYKNSSRDDLKALCESRKAQCAGLIRYDNWEIKDDYPW